MGFSARLSAPGGRACHVGVFPTPEQAALHLARAKRDEVALQLARGGETKRNEAALQPARDAGAMGLEAKDGHAALQMAAVQVASARQGEAVVQRTQRGGTTAGEVALQVARVRREEGADEALEDRPLAVSAVTDPAVVDAKVTGSIHQRAPTPSLNVSGGAALPDNAAVAAHAGESENRSLPARTPPPPALAATPASQCVVHITGASGQGGALAIKRRHQRWTIEEEARLGAVVAEEEAKINREAGRMGERGGGGRAGGSRRLEEMYSRVAERMGGLRSAHACRLRMRQLRGGGEEG